MPYTTPDRGPAFDAAVQRVMNTLGFDYIQARNHVIAAQLLRSLPPVKM